MAGRFPCIARDARGLVWACAVVLLSLPLPAFAGRPGGAAPLSWGAPATLKIRPTDTPPTATEASQQVDIWAARNEFESFQVGFSGAARKVTATASDLTGPSGYVIHSCSDDAPGCVRNIHLYAQPLITLRRASSSDLESAPGAWPDALVPQFDEIYGEPRDWNVMPRAGESHAIWVEVFVPANAPAGTYTGTVTVSLDSNPLTPSIGVTLHVWPFTLPSTASATSSFVMNWGAIGNGFGISQDSDFHALRYAFGSFALDHRISVSRIDDGWTFTDPASLQGYYGHLLNPASFPQPTFVPPQRPERLAGAQMTSVEYLDTTSSTRIGDWTRFATTNGWADALFQYTYDEPPDDAVTWDTIKGKAAIAHGATPPMRTLVTTTIDSAKKYGATGLVDVLVPVINYMDDKTGLPYAGDQRSKYETFLAPGLPKELWMYQSCMSHDCGGSQSWATGWPSYMIDASAIRNRAMQWMLYRYGATGELYWDVGYALSQPRNDAWRNQWYFTGNGDGTLFYPGTVAKIGGTHPIPIASIRLKMIREGMEDYEYLKILERCGLGTDAANAASRVFANAYSAGAATLDGVNGLMTVRSEMADLIVSHGCSP